jgi:hypothetical protein
MNPYLKACEFSGGNVQDLKLNQIELKVNKEKKSQAPGSSTDVLTAIFGLRIGVCTCT